jgi:hypothetical protein
VETVTDGDGKAREGLLVTALCPSDQLGIHAFHQLPPGRPGCSYGMGAAAVLKAQISS